MHRSAFLNCECKGSGFLCNYQMIIHNLTHCPLCTCFFQTLPASVSVGHTTGMCACIPSHENVKLGVTYDKCFVSLYIEVMQGEGDGLCCRLLIRNIVGTNKVGDVLRQL